MAGYGAENQHEPVSFSQALLHATERINMIAALLPGPWNPAIAAKQIASIDNYTNGRISVNVVSGLVFLSPSLDLVTGTIVGLTRFRWFKQEFTSIGQWWLDHAERYRRSKEFIACLKGIWTQDQVQLIHKLSSKQPLTYEHSLLTRETFTNSTTTPLSPSRLSYLTVLIP